MKKILTYLAVTLLLMQSSVCVVNAAAEAVESGTITISAKEAVTDTDQICTILTAYFEENGLDSACFYAETYDLHPEYAGKIIVEFNYADSIGTNYGIDYDHLMEYLIEQNIPKESIRVVPLLNGEPYVQETASDTKVDEKVLDAFASGAQSVEVYILYKDIPVGEISAWSREQAALYAETLDKNVYSEEEIVNMESAYYSETVTEALKKERNARTAEILTVIGVDTDSAICAENYPRLSCVLTKDQVETAKGNELVRRITLKSEWKSAEDLGITTAIPEVSGSTTTTTTIEETEKITDIEQIRSMLIAFVEENGLDARIVSDKEYPGYRPIVVEFNGDAEINAWAVLSDYIEEQNIDKFNINVVPIVDGKPITTANPDVENTTTTTTTTTIEETEKITDIEQIRSMLIAFVEENGLDARIVSDKEYPGYRPIVVEFNGDAEINAWAVLSDYIEEQNIDKFNINVVPIVDGKPITTANPDVENTTTTTTTTTTDGTNTDLPQTGNNSVTNSLIAIAALMLTVAGAGAVHSSGILRRKENEK
ncbi:MAG: LPXTG cell wall anchor domain-containing protein [Ruminococcus sp.]|nr:LPXTG cell wall anchor domain-containing protein [Ruminococcus sp.]